jgi:predicted TIM-barrel fold metal-dependent hydrolase
VPIAIHPTYEPYEIRPARFAFSGWSSEAQWYLNVLVRQGVQQAFLTFFALGTLERFPTLRLGVLESGSGWIGSLLDRMDAVYDSNVGRFLQLRDRPSHYFRRQCFISGDPDETAAPLIMEHVGAEHFLWATDYPHPDHPGTWVPALTRLVERLSPAARADVLGANVNRIYGVR